MTYYVEQPLPLHPCDICGTWQGVTWWLGTSATVCRDPACHAAHAEAMAEHNLLIDDGVHIWR